MAKTQEIGTEEFDVEKTIKAFEAVPKDGSRPAVCLTKEYIAAIKEMCNFFNICGSGFGFVTSDVSQKLILLEKHRTERDLPNGIDNLQGMMQWEEDNDMFDKDVKYNGARTLLRLNRASQFVMLLIKYIMEREKASMSSNAYDAYSETLMRFHSWMIKKAVGVAVYAIPSRHTLLKNMKMTEDEARESLPRLVVAIDTVFSALDKHYTEHKLQKLP
ncbi:hypothetical protein SARC_00254 [Sphaeroforma arctica JP610]|uniref:Glycolipid transfer protein domain-containing protein n=1 Tax=Sphaeroforma arctica JP610 TaxID=667725 RepID=A0A0L0GH20_9EUKA|nr:hypothetical protein SARC_00254 [Sphaeroforma arctica JP610]KNC87623.1 hypothetical protein SARC_00254 [Sphaeroforma arctica JP610]|eukprot:XP_014161525.1 hypothetical protein SARC_00254 [Sphaeroforma arctica JP610]